MDELRLYWLKIVKLTIFCLLVGFAFALLLKGFWFGLGLVIGTIFGIANFTLLAKDVQRSVGLGRLRVGIFFFTHHLLRYLIAALALVLSWRVGGLSTFLGAAMGLLMVKIAIYADLLLGKKQGLTVR